MSCSQLYRNLSLQAASWLTTSSAVLKKTNLAPASLFVRNLVSRSTYIPDINNITYSGGQATTGQGGFYGSGATRAAAQARDRFEQRAGALAALEDVAQLRALMDQVEALDADLRAQEEQGSPRAVQTRATLKKLLTSARTTELMKRLMMNGQPVWGLTQSERELVRSVQEAINSC
mmetsp:Transcript_22570/g.36489  ORF Transcript_22570/g.36489 Transcript_22570/m.36489 type:complete len:176 (-) Transcript_22570:339-866(-)